MLAGPGLATAQKLADAGWVGVGALPLMVLDGPDLPDVDGAGVRALTEEEPARGPRPAGRHLQHVRRGRRGGRPPPGRGGPDLGEWGLFDGDRMVSSFTGATEDGLVVVWSTATRPRDQWNGYGRRVLATALRSRFEAGAEGSLLQSSAEGERLYRGLGYEVFEYWQLWSRPGWVLGRA